MGILQSVARSEAGIARALVDGVRRRREVRPGEAALPYAGRFGLVVGVLCVLGGLETVVVHLLLPWEVARWVLLAVSVYALLWMVGFGLSLRQHPHVVRDGALVLRFGHLRSVVVPLSGLVAVRRHVETGHRRTVVHDGDRLVVSVMGDTNVELRVDPPVRVPGQAAPVARVAFYVDDPGAAVRELRARVPGRAG
ncbi:hypothetical protein ACI789_03930 [Geodermatophilus sp. SYSU D00965]